MTEDKNLSFFKPLVFLGVFVLLVAALAFVMNRLNLERQERVYQTYASETNRYIDDNRGELIEILASASASYKGCVDFDYYSNCFPTNAYLEKINAKLSHDLVDWPSTAFLFKVPGRMEIFALRVSGGVDMVNSTNEQSEVRKLMDGEIDKIPWSDVSYLFQDKEVVVPIKDSSGKTVGAVMRGVIEKNSF